MKPIDFAYALKQLTEGFGQPPLTEQRAMALFDEYGGSPGDVVKRAVTTLLQGDRYPTADAIRKAFQGARLWDHEQRRRIEWRSKRGGARVDQVLESLAHGPALTSHPMVSEFCIQAFRLYCSGTKPPDMARFFRTMANEPPLAFMDLHAEADQIEAYGPTWPVGAPLFPISGSSRPGHAEPQHGPPAAQPAAPTPAVQEGFQW